jgi:hypothetical protein
MAKVAPLRKESSAGIDRSNTGPWLRTERHRERARTQVDKALNETRPAHYSVSMTS